MDQKRILVIEDEKPIADILKYGFEKEGFEVACAHTGGSGLEKAEEYEPDMVLLDWMLPDIAGVDVCRMLTERYNIPIIMLSAKSSDADKIIGLNLGADDYMTKPFNPLELVARVKSQLRRFTTLNPNPQTATDLILIRDLCIDQKKHIVTIRGENATLTPIEFEILVLLCSHPNIVFSMEEIFEKVWKERYYDSNNTVMVHIRKLREKIEKNPRYPEYIKTVWGVGYKVEN